MVGDIMQPTHLLFVLVVALLVLGPKRLPEVGRQLGNGLRDFRAAINGERPEHHDEVTGAANPLAAEPAVATDPAEAQTGHEFGHQDSEPIAEEHEFAHHAPEAAVEHDVTSDASESPAEHEFAYETSQPADKPADPLS
jgi:sec-independent protein translocase protein TatA